MRSVDNLVEANEMTCKRFVTLAHSAISMEEEEEELIQCGARRRRRRRRRRRGGGWWFIVNLLDPRTQ